LPARKAKLIICAEICARSKIILEIFFPAASLDQRQSSGVRSSSFTAKNSVVSSEAAFSVPVGLIFLNRPGVDLSD